MRRRECGDGVYRARKVKIDATITTDFAGPERLFGNHALAKRVHHARAETGVARAVRHGAIGGTDVAITGGEKSVEHVLLGRAAAIAFDFSSAVVRGGLDGDKGRTHETRMRAGARDRRELHGEDDTAWSGGGRRRVLDLAGDGGVRSEGAVALLPGPDGAEIEDISRFNVGAPDGLHQLGLADD
jgi:hypothetical protein